MEWGLGGFEGYDYRAAGEITREMNFSLLILVADTDYMHLSTQRTIHKKRGHFLYIVKQKF